MRAATLRVWLIGLIVVAAVVSFFGNRQDNKIVNAIGFGVFLVAVLLYAYWRRAVRQRARC